MYFLAIKHLLSRPVQTTVLLIGIMLGSAGYVMFSGLQTGQEEFMIDRLVNINGAVTISPAEEFINSGTFKNYFFTDNAIRWLTPPSGRKDLKYLQNPTGWYQFLSNDSEVKAYAPTYSINTIIKKGQISKSVKLNGIIPESFTRVINIEHDITTGSILSLSPGSVSIIISEQLARIIGVRIGQAVSIIAEDGTSHPVKVTAFFNTGTPRLDETTVYTSISMAQKIGKSTGRISSIVVSLKDIYKAETVAGEWSASVGDKIESWAKSNQNFISLLDTQRTVKNATMLVIITVVAFSIYNMLSMVVNQKKKDIAILRSMGFSKNDTIILFLIQGIILALSGAILGLIFGALGCLYLSTLKIGIGGGNLIISFDPIIYLTAIILVIISSVVSSILPARTAGRMSPIDIIRGA